MKSLVLLAGGRSTRMSLPKGLLEYKGQTWLTHQLEAFAAAGGERAVVVLGFDHEKYRERIPELNSKSFLGLSLEVVVNSEPARGQFSSLLTGLEKAQDGAFVLPVDVPAASPEIWRKLELALQEKVFVAQPVHDDRGGHPVLLSSAFVSCLLEIPPEEGRLDELIRELQPGELARVAVDDAKIELNLNQPSDWNSFNDS